MSLGILSKQKISGLCFFSKNWSTKEQMERIKIKLNFDGLFTVTNEDRGGGLTLMWKNSSFVLVDIFSSYHIDAIINGGTEYTWRLGILWLAGYKYS